MSRTMAKKAERESQSNVSDVQGDTDGDITLSETVYSDWCEPRSVETLVVLHNVCYQNWSRALT